MIFSFLSSISLASKSKDTLSSEYFNTVSNNLPVLGKQIKEDDVKLLLTDKKTKLIKGFKSKAGKKFDAYLILGDEGNIGFEFEDSYGERVQSDVECPKCHNKLLKDNRAYNCDCGFKFYYVIAKKTLTDIEVNELLTN